MPYVYTSTGSRLALAQDMAYRHFPPGYFLNILRYINHTFMQIENIVGI